MPIINPKNLGIQIISQNELKKMGQTLANLENRVLEGIAFKTKKSLTDLVNEKMKNKI